MLDYFFDHCFWQDRNKKLVSRQSIDCPLHIPGIIQFGADLPYVTWALTNLPPDSSKPNAVTIDPLCLLFVFLADVHRLTASTR